MAGAAQLNVGNEVGNEWLYVYLLPLLGVAGFALFIWLVVSALHKERQRYARPVLTFGLLLALFGILGSELATRSDVLHLVALFFAKFIWWVIILSLFWKFTVAKRRSA